MRRQNDIDISRLINAPTINDHSKRKSRYESVKDLTTILEEEKMPVKKVETQEYVEQSVTIDNKVPNNIIKNCNRHRRKNTNQNQFLQLMLILHVFKKRS